MVHTRLAIMSTISQVLTHVWTAVKLLSRKFVGLNLDWIELNWIEFGLVIKPILSWRFVLWVV